MALSAQQVAAIRSSLPPGVSYSDEQIQQMYSQGAGSAEFQDSKFARVSKYVYDTLGRLTPETRAKLITEMNRSGLDGFFQGTVAGGAAANANRIKSELGMSDDEVAALAHMYDAVRFGDEKYFANKSKELEADPKISQILFAAEKAGAPQAAGPSLAGPQSRPGDVDQRAKITAQIQEFYDRMNAPVTDANGNITEPIVKQLATIGRNMGLQGASGRGIQGGAASLTAGASAQANALPYLQQRASLAQQANQMLQSGQISYEQLNQDAYRLDLQAQQLNNAQAIGGYNGQVAGAQGTGAIIGGALGGLAGGLAGQGNPLAIGAGLSTGASLGGAIGGQSVQKPTLAPYRPYSGS